MVPNRADAHAHSGAADRHADRAAAHRHPDGPTANGHRTASHGDTHRRACHRHPAPRPNYKDADLGQVIEAVSQVTGKNFIVDPRVRAQVTMLSATPMSAGAFYEAFLAILQVHGFVAVPVGNVITITLGGARDLPGRLPANKCPRRSE